MKKSTHILITAAITLTAARSLILTPQAAEADYTSSGRTRNELLISPLSADTGSSFTIPHGLVTHGGITAYFNNYGIAVEGWKTIHGDTYCFTPEAAVGITSIDGSLYNFDAAGKEITGWAEENGKKYYFSPAAAKGLVNIDDAAYYFNEDGEMMTGWIQINGSTYYFAEDGKMLKDTSANIDGCAYTFSSDGMPEKETHYTETINTAAAAETTSADNCGNIGNLRVPALGIDIALNDTSDINQLQAVVDAEDSALYHTFTNALVIGDHAYQGFSAIQNAAGMTAEITYLNGTSVKYICTGVYHGNNNGDLVLSGVSVTDHPLGDLTMYTCMDESGYNVWLTSWNIIG